MAHSLNDVDWAEIVDVLAHEYGWTIDYIETLTMSQANLLIKAISTRYRAQNDAMSGKKSSMSSGKFQPSDEETIVGTMVAWGAKKEVGEDGRIRYKL